MAHTPQHGSRGLTQADLNNMAIFIGLDLGTTTITALALCDAGEPVVAVRSVANDTRIAASQSDRFDWDAQAIAARAEDCLRALVDDLGPRQADVAAIGVTGQQHGVVNVDSALTPLTPFINWQDRRGDEPAEAGQGTWVDEAQRRLGADAWRRTGCTLATGHLGLTLYWMRRNGRLPPQAKALSIMEFITARLAGGHPVTEPTCAAGSGIFNVVRRDWDRDAIAALELPESMFPEVCEAGTQVGRLADNVATRIGLPAGLPVAAPLGDQQAGFVGSVKDRAQCGHLNVGTGAQIAAFVEGTSFEPPLELRPFPVAGNLLTGAVLCGGWSYQVLEQFVRRVGREALGVSVEKPVYEILNELAAAVPTGADGLVCEPLFAGTRADPSRRAQWRGMTAGNFTPGHMARALLEGMAREYASQLVAAEERCGRKLSRLVATGNGMRENRLLRELVAMATGLPVEIPKHREEAAFGAALLAAVSVGQFADLDDAGRLVQYQ